MNSKGFLIAYNKMFPLTTIFDFCTARGQNL